MLQLLEGKEQVGSYQTPKSLQASEFLCTILRMKGIKVQVPRALVIAGPGDGVGGAEQEEEGSWDSQRGGLKVRKGQS